MQTVHIESLCVYASTRAFMAVGVIWASRWCHSHDSGIVKDLWIDLVTAVEGAFTTKEAGGLVDAIIGDCKDSIEG